MQSLAGGWDGPGQEKMQEERAFEREPSGFIGGGSAASWLAIVFGNRADLSIEQGTGKPFVELLTHRNVPILCLINRHGPSLHAIGVAHAACRIIV